MTTSGIVLHYIGWAVHSLTPTKYTVLNGNFRLDLHDVFQICNSGIK